MLTNNAHPVQTDTRPAARRAMANDDAGFGAIAYAALVLIIKGAPFI